MQWTAEPLSAMGVTEQPFVVERVGDRIPGIFWTPANTDGPVPVVLLGHGGGADKRHVFNLRTARALARDHGIAAAAIDMPGHGERGRIRIEDGPDSPGFIALRADPGTVDRVVSDWRATVDELAKLPGVDAGRIGYWGFSQGGLLGLPLIAAEPRIRAAVLGNVSLSGAAADRWNLRARHRADAARVGCPVAFFLQLQDEVMDVAGAFELFALLCTADKQLHAYPGGHLDTPPPAGELSRSFLAERLKA